MKRILSTIGALLLLTWVSHSQVLERYVKATETLETGDEFVYQSVDIPVLDITYHEWSADSVTWRKNFVSGDCYIRFSNDVKTTWAAYNICSGGGSGTSSIDTIFWTVDGVTDTIISGSATLYITEPDTISGTSNNTQNTETHTHELYIELNDNEDVSANPSNGQVIKWNSTTETWEAADDLIGGGAAGYLNVKEQDGSPDVSNVNEIRIANGSLTDNGSGSISIDFSLEAVNGAQDFFRTDTVRVDKGDRFITFSSPLPDNNYIISNVYADYDDNTQQQLVSDSLAADGFRVLSILEDGATVNYLVMRSLDSLGLAVTDQGRILASGSDETLGYLNQKVDHNTIEVVDDELVMIADTLNLELLSTDVIVIGSDSLRATTQLSANDTISATKDYVLSVAGTGNGWDSLVYQPSNGYAVWWYAGSKIDSTSFDDRYVELADSTSLYVTPTQLSDTTKWGAGYSHSLVDLDIDPTNEIQDTSQIVGLQTFVENHSGSGSSPWVTDPNGIRYNGNVGINSASSSTYKLGIGGDIRASDGRFEGGVFASSGFDIEARAFAPIPPFSFSGSIWMSSTDNKLYFTNFTDTYNLTGGGNVSTSGTPIANDFAKFVNGTDIEGRSYSETKIDLGLNLVENAAASGLYEPLFSKNTGFNKNFGTIAGTVVQGNDSRIVANSAFTATPSSIITAGTNMSWSGNTLNVTGGASPLTTKGDLYTYSTTDTRLPTGTYKQSLRSTAYETTGLIWSMTNPTMAEIKNTSTTGAMHIAHGTAWVDGYLYVGERVDNGQPTEIARFIKYDENTLEEVDAYEIGANLDAESITYDYTNDVFYITVYNSSNYLEIREIDPSSMTIVGSTHIFTGISAGNSPAITNDGTYIYGVSGADPGVFFKIDIATFGTPTTNTWTGREKGHSVRMSTDGLYFYASHIPYSSATNPYFAKVAVSDLTYSEVNIGAYVKKTTDDFAVVNDGSVDWCYLGGEYDDGNYNGVKVNASTLALTGLPLRPTYGLKEFGDIVYSASIDGYIEMLKYNDEQNVITYDLFGQFINEIAVSDDGRVFATYFDGSYNETDTDWIEMLLVGNGYSMQEGSDGGISFGSQYQIPHTNSTTDDFDYLSTFRYQNGILIAPMIQLSTVVSINETSSATPATGCGTYRSGDDGKPYYENDSGHEWDLSNTIYETQSTSLSSYTKQYEEGHLFFTLNNNITLNVQNIRDGGERNVYIKQDATGGKTLGLVLLSTSIITLTQTTVSSQTSIATGSNAVTKITYQRIGSNAYVTYQHQ